MPSNDSTKCVVTVVGGGNSALVLLALLGERSDLFTTQILTRRPDAWKKTVKLDNVNAEGKITHVFKSTIGKVSDDPADVIPASDVVILCMPVCAYRDALHKVAPYLRKNLKVYVGTIYGQAGFNWMVDEVRTKFTLESNVVGFAVGLIPWICRTVDYGTEGILYGGKQINLVAMDQPQLFDEFNGMFLKYISEVPLGVGAFSLCPNFLSLTLTVDNQFIHTARCFGLMSKIKAWKSKEAVPFFYRDFDQYSADTLNGLDREYEMIRAAIRERYPGPTPDHWRYFMTYLEQERFVHQKETPDILKSFTESTQLQFIKPPVVFDEAKEGYVIDRNHRFFMDDIYYGLMIAKWLAEHLNIQTPYLVSLLAWAGMMRHEDLIDPETGKLRPLTPEQLGDFKYGTPACYGIDGLEGDSLKRLLA